MTPIESHILALLTERRRQGEGWTSLNDIRRAVKFRGDYLASAVSRIPGVESRGGWELGQQFQVRLKELPA